MSKFLTIALAVGLLFMGCGTVYAFPGSGPSCATCHTNPGGSVTADPDPLVILVDDNGLVTFDVTDLGGSSTTVIALSAADLDDPLLDATIGAGGDTWTFQGASNTYTSDEITALGAYTLELVIGSNAEANTYGIGGELVGNGARLSGFDFSVEVIPEPTTLMLAMLGIGCTGFCIWRRKRAT